MRALEAIAELVRSCPAMRERVGIGLTLLGLTLLALADTPEVDHVAHDYNPEGSVGGPRAPEMLLPCVEIMSKPRRSKIPLLFVMAGGLCFALGRRILGLVLSGVGAMLFALRPSDTPGEE